MASTSTSSPKHQLIPLGLRSATETTITTSWQPILQASNQVVLYNPTNHALSVVTPASKLVPARHLDTSRDHPRHAGACPYCHRPFVSSTADGAGGEASHHHPLPQSDTDGYGGDSSEYDEYDEDDEDPTNHARTSDYFQLLAIANESLSRPSTPPLGENDYQSTSGGREPKRSAFKPEAMANGYFNAFFKEECKLGMGANGSVFLCQHVLDSNPLGHFAVKKIAVGESHSYLLNILREVRLLETLRHPHIITYHHVWLETTQFSPFGPRIPTLHVLMQWAEGGSLDDFIDARLGMPSSRHDPSQEQDPMSRSARIRAFKQNRGKVNSPPELKRSSNSHQQWTAVHLFSAEEARSLFGDVVEGLAFLHEKSILHLDLKPGNVLLTWDEGRLVPRAMLSDFGTSRDMINTSRVARSGNTGTLEYCSPESLPAPHTGVLQSLDSKSDMWSLGMVLHKMLFFRLPYDELDAAALDSRAKDKEKDRLDWLENSVASYRGFKSTVAQSAAFAARRLPRTFLVLLETLLNPSPVLRPSCDRVLQAIREGRLDPINDIPLSSSSGGSELVPLIRKRSSSLNIGVGTNGSQQSTSMAPVPVAIPGPSGAPVPLLHGILTPVPTEREKADELQKPHDDGPPVEPFKRNDSIPGNIRATLAELGRALMWRRGVKACVFAAKMMSMTNSPWLQSSLHRPTGNWLDHDPFTTTITKDTVLIWSTMMLLALVDAMADRMDVCMVLGAAHIGLLRCLP